MIREPWISQILMGRKTWELRGTPTKIRGRLALIRSGSGLIIGECQLDDCVGPVGFDTLIATGALSSHERDDIEREGHAPYVAVDGVTSKTFAWIVSRPILYSQPVAYNHPSGAITFVDLTKQGVIQCIEASSSTNKAMQAASRQLQLL
ncbi:ASCH domain-containing protein [Labrys sp. 22185]|uniref:ASCH domain-containing protein n=1 Tax=Labrys sp. 22185 TaxID=3453888 RepID=UPI003F84D196